MITISGINVVPGGTNAPSMYDIGYSLSQASRFGGHTRKPWTVLQHLYAAFHLAKLLDLDELMQLYALLHDAHEAIISDIPHPWKTEDMRNYQKELDARIYLSIGIDVPELDDQLVLKGIDNMLLNAEAEIYGPRKLGDSDPIARKALKLVGGLKSSPEANGAKFAEHVEDLLNKLIYATR